MLTIVKNKQDIFGYMERGIGNCLYDFELKGLYVFIVGKPS